MQHETVIVVAGGEAPADAVPGLPQAGFVIAADGGLDRAQTLGLRVDLAIGDFDSVSATALAAAETTGTRVERHPEAKDATDLELSLDAAIALGPSTIVVVGSDGGRLDHLLGSLLLLADERYAAARITAHLGASRVDVVRGAVELDAAPGSLLSLLPVHGDAEGVTTEGLAYPLRGETLHRSSSRGISNVVLGERVRVTVARGCLLAVAPASEGGCS